MKSTYKRNLLAYATLSVLAITSTRAADIAPADARAIAKEACICRFPMMDGYRMKDACCVDRALPEDKAEVDSSRDEHK